MKLLFKIFTAPIQAFPYEGIIHPHPIDASLSHRLFLTVEQEEKRPVLGKLSHGLSPSLSSFMISAVFLIWATSSASALVSERMNGAEHSQDGCYY